MGLSRRRTEHTTIHARGRVRQDSVTITTIAIAVITERPDGP